MTVIHRAQFRITDETVLTLPGYRRTIHAAPSREYATGIPRGLGVEVWYEAYQDEPGHDEPVDVRFYVHGTGHPFDHPHAEHVATFGDSLIWHVYVEYPTREAMS